MERDGAMRPTPTEGGIPEDQGSFPTCVGALNARIGRPG